MSDGLELLKPFLPGLDSATDHIVVARLDGGSRVAITVRHFGKRASSAADLVEQDALPENVRRNILV